MKFNFSTSNIELTEQASAPATPAPGELVIYSKTDKHLYTKDETGTETDLMAGGGGSAPLNEIVFGTGAGTTSDPNFTYDPTTAPGQFYVNTNDGATITVLSPTPGSVAIFAASCDINGNGGIVTIAAGDGGATTGDGGEVDILGGNTTDNTAAGGNVIITAGSPAADGSGSGGLVVIRGGHVAGGTETGGDVEIHGGQYTSGGAPDTGSAGTATLFGGNSSGSGVPGSANVAGGNASGTGIAGGNAGMVGGGATDGDGGSIFINGTSGGGADRNGGNVQIVAGNATGVGAAGVATLVAGDGGSTGSGSAGGNVAVTAGNAGGAGDNNGGNVTITAGTPTGVGTPGIITLDGISKFKTYSEATATPTISAGTLPIDLTTATVFNVALDSSVTNPLTGSITVADAGVARTNSFLLVLTGSGGAQTVNWGTIQWAGGTPPSLTTNGVDIFTFFSPDGGTTWYGSTVGLAFA